VRALVADARRPDRSTGPEGSSVGSAQTPRLRRTAASLMSTTVLTSLLGLGFWAAAARLYPVEQVGLDSALISLLGTISTVTQLNLSNTIVRFLPLVRRVKRRIGQAYAAAAAFSLAVGGVFVVGGPALIPRYHFLSDNGLLAAAFVVGLAAFAIFSLQDSVLIALGRATWLPVENGLFALAKVAVLPIALVALGKSGHGVLVAWVIPLFATVAIINWLLVRRVLPRLERPTPERGRGVGRGSGLATFVSLDLVGTILGQLSGAAIPLIVVASLGASENAYFFLPYTLVTTLDLVFLGLSTAITAEASRDESRLRELVGQAARYLAALQLPAVIAIVVFAPLVLKVFGPAYARHGVTLIRLLAAASVFRSLLWVFLSTARVQRRGWALLAVEAVTAALLVGLMIAVSKHAGVDGIALVWLAVHAGMAALVLPWLVRMLRRSPAPAPGASGG
jgi:O-antigen/teichoic acid export membrane protein